MAARQFGATWWGGAWVHALEERAALDPNRLARGRTYARQDRVARVEVATGKVTALVRGNRALPYRVTVTIPTYGDAEWTSVAAAIAERAAHAAALLDGELDPGVAEAAEAAGVPLFPGPGDLKPRCSCPDWADPCKHAAAVCYLVADALDADPFVLFALRGTTRDQLMGRVRAQRTWAAQRPAPGTAPDAPGVAPPPTPGPGGSGRMVAAAFGGGAVVDPGMVAREAWSRPLGPPPERRELPKEPGAPASWPADPPRDAPFTAAGLTELATDAARRAWAQLGDGEPSQLALDEQTDLARRAAERLGKLESLLELLPPHRHLERPADPPGTGLAQRRSRRVGGHRRGAVASAHQRHRPRARGLRPGRHRPPGGPGAFEPADLGGHPAARHGRRSVVALREARPHVGAGRTPVGPARRPGLELTR
ncbi:SWIM zinc finger family protein [Aquihabitans daechungensis]|uniref:SWIM zinc finger family protein n=1 Tax=Aquihabitans daechungensis TaxID=1052257 RepID=UPI003BA37769